MRAKQDLPVPGQSADGGPQVSETLQVGLDAINSPAMLADAQARIVATNAAAREWLGEQPDELARLGSFVVPDLTEPWPSILTAAGAVTVGGRRTTGGTQAQHVLVTVAPCGSLRLVIFASDHSAAIGTTSGTSEAARFAQLLDAVSHELRNPLTTILGMSEMLLDGDVGDLTPEQERLVKHVYRGAARLTAALDALLDLSRLCARKRAVEPVPVHVRFCLERVTDLLKSRPQADNYKLGVEVSDRDLQCTTDPRLLERTLLELIEYSLRRGAGGSYCLRAEAADGGLIVSLVDCVVEQKGMGQAGGGSGDHLLGSSVAHELARVLGLKIGGPSAGKDACVFWVFVPSEI